MVHGWFIVDRRWLSEKLSASRTQLSEMKRCEWDLLADGRKLTADGLHIAVVQDGGVVGVDWFLVGMERRGSFGPFADGDQGAVSGIEFIEHDERFAAAGDLPAKGLGIQR